MNEPKQKPVRIAVIGAGLIGERHAKLVARHEMTELAAIVDPAPQSNELAKELNCKKLDDISELSLDDIDGAIIATPNANHLKSGLFFANKNIPCLIEKPIADNLKNAELLEPELKRSLNKKNLAFLSWHLPFGLCANQMTTLRKAHGGQNLTAVLC
jgi:predicted dehydrogenase